MYISPLSIGRAFITIQSMAVSSNSLLIAIKYSCTRRQFEGSQKKEEQLLIDYPLVRFRLMPLLASTFVFFMGGANILKSYDANFKQVLKPKSKLANELHGISAAAKARSSWFATEVIATCRQLLGGHGYSGFSRLGRLYNDQDVNTTWEGDNHMLLQQSVKYILNTVKALRETPNPANILNFVNQVYYHSFRKSTFRKNGAKIPFSQSTSSRRSPKRGCWIPTTSSLGICSN